MRLALALVAAVALAACGGSGDRAAVGKRGLNDADTVADFQQLFDAAGESPRLVVLLSPT